MQLVFDSSGCSSQCISWSLSNRYLNRSKLASTRLCNNHSMWSSHQSLCFTEARYLPTRSRTNLMCFNNPSSSNGAESSSGYHWLISGFTGLKPILAVALLHKAGFLIICNELSWYHGGLYMCRIPKRCSGVSGGRRHFSVGLWIAMRTIPIDLLRIM